MSNESDLQEVEISIDQANRSINKMRSFQKLTENKHFQEIVEEDYFQTEPSRLVLLKAAPAMQTPEDQEFIDNQMIAIGFLRQYFVSIMQRGRTAESAIESHEQTRDEIMAEV